MTRIDWLLSRMTPTHRHPPQHVRVNVALAVLAVALVALALTLALALRGSS